MGFQNQEQDDSFSDINVTPMVDVMLVLLIIFMVAAPLLQHGVDVELPQAKTGTIEYHEDQLTVVIKKDGSIHLARQEIKLNELGKKIAALQETNSKLEIFLQADKKVAYGLVVQVMATLKNAGIQKLGMVTDPRTLDKK